MRILGARRHCRRRGRAPVHVRPRDPQTARHDHDHDVRGAGPAAPVRDPRGGDEPDPVVLTSSNVSVSAALRTGNALLHAVRLPGRPTPLPPCAVLDGRRPGSTLHRRRRGRSRTHVRTDLVSARILDLTSSNSEPPESVEASRAQRPTRPCLRSHGRRATSGLASDARKVRLRPAHGPAFCPRPVVIAIVRSAFLAVAHRPPDSHSRRAASDTEPACPGRRDPPPSHSRTFDTMTSPRPTPARVRSSSSARPISPVTCARRCATDTRFIIFPRPTTRSFGPPSQWPVSPPPSAHDRHDLRSHRGGRTHPPAPAMRGHVARRSRGACEPAPTARPLPHIVCLVLQASPRAALPVNVR